MHFSVMVYLLDLSIELRSWGVEGYTPVLRKKNRNIFCSFGVGKIEYVVYVDIYRKANRYMCTREFLKITFNFYMS